MPYPPYPHMRVANEHMVPLPEDDPNNFGEELPSATCVLGGGRMELTAVKLSTIDDNDPMAIAAGLVEPPNARERDKNFPDREGDGDRDRHRDSEDSQNISAKKEPLSGRGSGGGGKGKGKGSSLNDSATSETLVLNLRQSEEDVVKELLESTWAYEI